MQGAPLGADNLNAGDFIASLILFKSFPQICNIQLCWFLWPKFAQRGHFYANHQN